MVGVLAIQRQFYFAAFLHCGVDVVFVLCEAIVFVRVEFFRNFSTPAYLFWADEKENADAII